MKRVAIDTRCDVSRLVQKLAYAVSSLEAARDSLTDAEVTLQELQPTAAWDELRNEVRRIRAQLYADGFAGVSGGDAEAWDLRSVMLRAGEVACKVEGGNA